MNAHNTAAEPLDDSDLPAQMIVVDTELRASRPEKAYYLRLKVDGGCDHVDLGNATCPAHARSIARGMGYEPTHWRSSPNGGRPCPF